MLVTLSVNGDCAGAGIYLNTPALPGPEHMSRLIASTANIIITCDGAFCIGTDRNVTGAME